MIRIRITRRGDGVDIHAVGHAGYAPRGADVVCAGVSALLYGFVASLDDLSSVATAEESGCSEEFFHWTAFESDGELRVRTRGCTSRIEGGVSVVVAGLSLIARTYPQLVVLEDIISQEGDVYEST